MSGEPARRAPQCLTPDEIDAIETWITRVRAQQLTPRRGGLVLALVALARRRRARSPTSWCAPGPSAATATPTRPGGGKRTPFAQIHARDILHDLDLLPIPRGVKAFTGEVNSWISIGADLRVRNTTVFQDPIRNGRVPNNTAFRENVTSNDTEVNEFLGYLQVDLWPDVATFYVD